MRDADTGAVVYTRTSSRRSQVASNLKLLTAVAAFDLPGPGFRWKTELLSSGTRTGPR